MTDHFSRQADAYATFRPTYPATLFDYVASVAPRRDRVWDCATGSGQAAVALADRFASVIATDASAAQLSRAPANPRVEYRVATAESSGLDAASVDAVTVAQALHWFDVERFYAEVRRVLVSGGALVVWTYGEPVLDDPALDAELQRFNDETVGGYWPAERQLVRDRYQTLAFPFDRLPVPEVTLERAWTLGELAGYMRSWSATARYTADRGHDPVRAFERAMSTQWGAASTPHTVTWPMTIMAGHRLVT